MSDKKITELPDGGAVQSTDEFVAARAGGNVKIAGSALGGSLPAPWTATDDNLVIPVSQIGGGTADAPYTIVDTETGIVADRAGGFQGDWEVFDLGKPGVGYGIATITAGDGDSLIWGTDLTLILLVDVSVDATNWINVYSTSGAQQAVMLLSSFGTPSNPVGAFSQYVLFTPRAIRFAVGILDAVSGLIYSGPQNPTVTYSFSYTAG